MKGQRFVTYGVVVVPAYGGGYRAVAVVGPKRDIVVAITRRWWTKTAAGAAIVRLMREKRR